MNSRPSPIVTYAATTARSASAPDARRIRPPAPVTLDVPAFEDEREQRADEEGVHPRVGAEVRAARIAVGQVRHEQCRGDDVAVARATSGARRPRPSARQPTTISGQSR